jgi:hypothetical protein
MFQRVASGATGAMVEAFAQNDGESVVWLLGGGTCWLTK